MTKTPNPEQGPDSREPHEEQLTPPVEFGKRPLSPIEAAILEAHLRRRGYYLGPKGTSNHGLGIAVDLDDWPRQDGSDANPTGDVDPEPTATAEDDRCIDGRAPGRHETGDDTSANDAPLVLPESYVKQWLRAQAGRYSWGLAIDITGVDFPSERRYFDSLVTRMQYGFIPADKLGKKEPWYYQTSGLEENKTYPTDEISLPYQNENKYPETKSIIDYQQREHPKEYNLSLGDNREIHKDSTYFEERDRLTGYIQEAGIVDTLLTPPDETMLTAEQWLLEQAKRYPWMLTNRGDLTPGTQPYAELAQEFQINYERPQPTEYIQGGITARDRAARAFEAMNAANAELGLELSGPAVRYQSIKPEREYLEELGFPSILGILSAEIYRTSTAIPHEVPDHNKNRTRPQDIPQLPTDNSGKEYPDLIVPLPKSALADDGRVETDPQDTPEQA